MPEYILWLKAFHIFSVICWFAAIFYLPRLFVYHAMSEDSISCERFKIMERKLYRGIMTPAAIATIALGAWMLIDQWVFYKTQPWMHVKLVMVFFLLGYHHACGRFVKKFAQDINTKSDRFFRIFNEVPVFFLLAIIILVVVRPQF